MDFRWLGGRLSGWGLFVRFAVSAFRGLLSDCVFVYFPFGFEGRMWDVIVSGSDHCLSFYFLDCCFSSEIANSPFGFHLIIAILRTISNIFGFVRPHIRRIHEFKLTVQDAQNKIKVNILHHFRILSCKFSFRQ